MGEGNTAIQSGEVSKGFFWKPNGNADWGKITAAAVLTSTSVGVLLKALGGCVTGKYWAIGTIVVRGTVAPGVAGKVLHHLHAAESRKNSMANDHDAPIQRKDLVDALKDVNSTSLKLSLSNDIAELIADYIIYTGSPEKLGEELFNLILPHLFKSTLPHSRFECVKFSITNDEAKNDIINIVKEIKGFQRPEIEAVWKSFDDGFGKKGAEHLTSFIWSLWELRKDIVSLLTDDPDQQLYLLDYIF